MDTSEIMLNFIMNFIVEPIWAIISFIWKFIKDVMEFVYKKLVVIVGLIILGYILSRFIK